MSLRIPVLLSALLALPACMPPMMMGMGTGMMGAPMATTAGPTAANYGITPGAPITAENCAAYRTMATQAMMMTPEIDAQLRAAGC